MSPLGGVGGRLALATLVVVAGALAIVYVLVVPRYETSLVDARITDLARSMHTVVGRRTDTFLTQQWVEDVAQPIANARVVVLSYNASPPVVEATADSNGGNSRDVENDPIALAAGQLHRAVHGTVARNETRFAEVAEPVGTDAVVLLAAPLHSQLETVNVVRRNVFVAGAVAIGFAILIAYTLATLFARRIRRLEESVERIADGRFDEAIVDPAGDELGQLARAVERMRLQLATLDRARSEFIANASHELRTPLFSLGGFLELLEGEELDAQTTSDFVEEMRDQVNRLTKLATDLLDLSRMDAGRLAVRDEEVDLTALAETVVGEFGPRALASDHTLADVSGDPVGARGDAERVLQIARILVENALVHTPPGTTVRVAATSDGGRAVLTVEDDGPGIPSDAFAHIFDRFYRLDGTLASGSGLGLAIARELAELMDGRIELESGDGHTRFALVLPTGAAAPRRLAVAETA